MDIRLIRIIKIIKNQITILNKTDQLLIQNQDQDPNQSLHQNQDLIQILIPNPTQGLTPNLNQNRSINLNQDLRVT